MTNTDTNETDETYSPGDKIEVIHPDGELEEVEIGPDGVIGQTDEGPVYQIILSDDSIHAVPETDIYNPDETAE